MSGLLHRPIVRPVVVVVRWLLIIGLWTIMIGALLFALGSLARIFTGDEQFGALDGFQFTDALYRATFRFILAAVAALVLHRVMKWRPGRPEHEDARRAHQKEPLIDDDPESDKPFKGRPRAWVIPEEEPVED